MLTSVWLRSASRRARTFQQRRLFSSLNTEPVPEHSIYISESTNPYFNLSFEDWLFRHKPAHEPLLLLYRDDPCVVIGRNQNPWKEVNFKALRALNGVPFIRRRSGGGTVYHDLGNTNFSIHLPRLSFDRFETAKIVLRAVRSLGIDANVNDRNDICVGKKKVSGSAYKIVNKRAYHHGTMLISTQLDTLGDLLRTNRDTMETKGVASVRSPVCNLQQFNTSVSHENFMNALIHEFKKEYGISEQPKMINEKGWENLDYINRGMNELPSWDWEYGQTPEFTYSVKEEFKWGVASARIRSKHGVILECHIQVHGADLPVGEVEKIRKLLEGNRYGFVGEQYSSSKSELSEIWQWLQRIMDS